MKVNRFVAMAAIALLVLGAMAAFASQSYAMGAHLTAGVHGQASLIKAQASTSVSPATSPACGPDQAQADGTEVQSATDTDNVDLQCGDQSTADVTSGSGAPETVGSSVDTGPNVDQQVNDQSGDQTAPDTGVQTPESGN